MNKISSNGFSSSSSKLNSMLIDIEFYRLLEENPILKEKWKRYEMKRDEWLEKIRIKYS